MKSITCSKLAQANALRLLNQASDSDLVEAGLQSLEDGLDSPSLRILAGLSDSYDAVNYFNKACSELGIAFQTSREAANFLIGCWMIEIVKGKIEPMEGCQKIIWKIYYNARDLVIREDEKVAGESIGLSELVGIYWSYDELEYGDKWYEKEKRMVNPMEGRRILDQEVIRIANEWIVMKQKEHQ